MLLKTNEECKVLGKIRVLQVLAGNELDILQRDFVLFISFFFLSQLLIAKKITMVSMEKLNTIPVFFIWFIITSLFSWSIFGNNIYKKWQQYAGVFLAWKKKKKIVRKK